MTLIVNSTDPLIIALDTTGSMQKRDAPTRAGQSSASRFDYARERIHELLERLPRETEVTLVSFSTYVTPHCFAASARQAAAVLGILEANGSECHTGAVLEWIHHSTLVKGARRASLLLITDGEPEDLVRFEAYAHYNALHENKLAVHVLMVGHPLTVDGDDPKVARKDLPAVMFAALGRSERHSIGELHGTEIMLGKPASTPPGQDFARAPTQPPSVSPPSGAAHADNEYVQPAKHAPAKPAAEGGAKGKGKK